MRSYRLSHFFRVYGTVLILCGDVPLVKEETLRSFIDAFQKRQSVLSVMTVVVEDPSGMDGLSETRRDGWKGLWKKKMHAEEEKVVREINTGIYCVKAPFTGEGLKEIGKENAQGEYYLTDLVEIAKKKRIEMFCLSGDRSRGGDGDQHARRSCHGQ